MKRTRRFMRTLSSDIHFYTAQLERTPVVVFVAGELVGSGRIEEITQESVKIGNDRYLRAVCEFKYAV
ncbi:hypothetical protein NYE69_27135 [Paenibacillus sp. FSL R5-0527]|uniref:hypothetical protein n=1 Tax=Paenibacillus sp. FSL R5-0527 TaxID=2975321 RepID=UPI002690CDD5